MSCSLDVCVILSLNHYPITSFPFSAVNFWCVVGCTWVRNMWCYTVLRSFASQRRRGVARSSAELPWNDLERETESTSWPWWRWHIGTECWRHQASCESTKSVISYNIFVKQTWLTLSILRYLLEDKWPNLRNVYYINISIRLQHNYIFMCSQFVPTIMSHWVSS